MTQDKQPQNDLLPCPFCGGEAKTEGTRFYKIICSQCGASEVRRIWQQRRAPQQISHDELVKEIDRTLEPMDFTYHASVRNILEKCKAALAAVPNQQNDSNKLPFVRWLYEYSPVAESYLRKFQMHYADESQTNSMLKSWFAGHNEHTKALLNEYKIYSAPSSIEAPKDEVNV